MNRIIYQIVIALAALSFWGCSSRPTPQEAIASTRMAIATGDYDLARRSINNVTTGDNSADMSACQLAEMAVLSMKLVDLAPEHGDATEALDFYDRATTISRDSVEAFALTLPLDEAQYLFTLSNLQRAREISSSDIPEHEDESALETFDEDTDML